MTKQFQNFDSTHFSARIIVRPSYFYIIPIKITYSLLQCSILFQLGLNVLEKFLSKKSCPKFVSSLLSVTNLSTKYIRLLLMN